MFDVMIEWSPRIDGKNSRLNTTDFQTTANVYSHVTKKLADEAVSKLEKFRPQSVSNPDYL